MLHPRLSSACPIALNSLGAAAQVLCAFATDTALVLAHVDIAEKSNEIPAAQTLLAELGVAKDTFVTLDALHCQKNTSKSQQKPTSR